MKKIECYLQPHDLDDVIRALSEAGVPGLSVTEIRGFGVQRGFARGEEPEPGGYVLRPKIKIELVVPDPDVERFVEVIQAARRGTRIGEGKLFVTPVEDALRTRTGERGVAALT